MKKIVFITTSPTISGNRDALIEESLKKAKECHAEVKKIDIRDLNISPCKECYGCAKTGVCVQKDDKASVLKELHECTGLIIEAPIYYNCMAAQALLVLDRLCCTFACKSYPLGPKKKVGIFLTCTVLDVEAMKHHVELIVNLPSIQRSIIDERTEVFTNCINSDTCKNNDSYLNRALIITQWICE